MQSTSEKKRKEITLQMWKLCRYNPLPLFDPCLIRRMQEAINTSTQALESEGNMNSLTNVNSEAFCLFFYVCIKAAGRDPGLAYRPYCEKRSGT